MSKINPRELEGRDTGVGFVFTGKLSVALSTDLPLQLPRRIAGCCRQERTNHIEHGVTEATNVHDLSSLASLRRLVRLDVDTN